MKHDYDWYGKHKIEDSEREIDELEKKKWEIVRKIKDLEEKKHEYAKEEYYNQKLFHLYHELVKLDAQQSALYKVRSIAERNVDNQTEKVRGINRKNKKDDKRESEIHEFIGVIDQIHGNPLLEPNAFDSIIKEYQQLFKIESLYDALRTKGKEERLADELNEVLKIINELVGGIKGYFNSLANTESQKIDLNIKEIDKAIEKRKAPVDHKYLEGFIKWTKIVSYNRGGLYKKEREFKDFSHFLDEVKKPIDVDHAIEFYREKGMFNESSALQSSKDEAIALHYIEKFLKMIDLIPLNAKPSTRFPFDKQRVNEVVERVKVKLSTYKKTIEDKLKESGYFVLMEKCKNMEEATRYIYGLVSLLRTNPSDKRIEEYLENIPDNFSKAYIQIKAQSIYNARISEAQDKETQQMESKFKKERRDAEIQKAVAKAKEGIPSKLISGSKLSDIQRQSELSSREEVVYKGGEYYTQTVTDYDIGSELYHAAEMAKREEEFEAKQKNIVSQSNMNKCTIHNITPQMLELSFDMLRTRGLLEGFNYEDLSPEKLSDVIDYVIDLKRMKGLSEEEIAERMAGEMWIDEKGRERKKEQINKSDILAQMEINRRNGFYNRFNALFNKEEKTR